MPNAQELSQSASAIAGPLISSAMHTLIDCGEIYGALVPRGVTKKYREIAAIVMATNIVVSFVFGYVKAKLDYTVELYYTALLSPDLHFTQTY
jgi:hypothetical protein